MPLNTGTLPITALGSVFNSQAYFIQTILNRISTAKIVSVQGSSNDGGVSAIGTVNVIPLVNQVDGAGNSVTFQTPIYNCAYARIQGGSNAVIIDPEVGDIGIAIFTDHDSSAVLRTQGPANPASNRRFDLADGIYLFSILSGVPTQYIQFEASGITMADANGNKIVMSAGGIALTGTLTINGLAYLAHTHSGVETGSGDTGPVVP